MKHLLLIFLFCSSLSNFCVSAKPDNELSNELNKLRKEDNLSDWIYLRIQHTGDKPSENLAFLMSTQQDSWRPIKSEREKEAWLYLLINQGHYQLYHGDILKSIEKYEEAYQFFNNNKVKIDADEYILKPLANNYTRIGDYERAIFIQRKSLAAAIKSKDHLLSASIYNNLAISYLFKKEYRNAEDAVHKGLKLVQPEHEIYGLLYSVLADINYQEDDLAKAAKHINIAIHHLEKKTSPYWLLSAYTLAGNVKFKQKAFREADNYYNQSINIITQNFKNARKRELAHLLTQKGKIALKKQDYKTANRLYDEALRQLIPSMEEKSAPSLPSKDVLFAENKLREVLLEKAKVLSLTGSKHLSLQANLLAFYTAEKIRHEYTYYTSKQQLQAETKLHAEALINQAYQLWAETKKTEYADVILVITERTKARILLDELMDNHQKLASKNPLYAEKIKLERAIAYYEKQQRENNHQALTPQIGELQFRLAGIQKQLKINKPEFELNARSLLLQIPAKTRALLFFVGERFIFLIDAQRGKINNIHKIAHADVIKQQTQHFLSEYFYNGPSAMMNAPEKFHQQSYQLYAQLFSNIRYHAGENLLLIKDGILNLLSFEGLISEKAYHSKINEWPFLIKKANISYAFSLNTIRPQSTSVATGPHSFSGFFLSNAGDNEMSIPAVETEYKYLKETLKGRFYKNEDAGISTFKESFSHVDVLHISSHAFLSEKDAEPVLELYKGKFYLFEMGAQFNVPQLVVLSACQTADGELISGEGVMSMSRGFIASGAKGVISGLWKVNDDSGARLINAFYQHLLELKDVEQSLRKAKLDWLNDEGQNKIMLLPYYWDSLVYAGNNQQVYLHQQTNRKLFFSIITILVVLAAWLFGKIKNKKSV